MIRRPPKPTLFPYPPLFRSERSEPVTTAATTPSKVTYTSANVDWDAFHRQFDEALAGVRGQLGRDHSLYIAGDRKSTRLNSSHLVISYAVFCLKKKNRQRDTTTSILRVTRDSVHTQR